MTIPTAGEEITEAFRQQYASLRERKMTANDIFAALWRFSGGEHFVRPDEVAAVAAVLTYFFGSCDIFENVPEE